MKNIAGMIIILLLMCGLLGLTAWGKGKTHTISFNEETVIHGTLVKEGKYQAKFDEQAGELTLSHGSHVIVTTKAKEEMLEKKASQTSYNLHHGDNERDLTKVTFAGDHYAIVLEED